MRRIFLFLFFVGFVRSHAQDPAASNQQKPLIEVLSSLETLHDIRFSYAPKILANRFCAPITESFSLEQKIKMLTSLTGLVFEVIDKRYIAVRMPALRKNQVVCAFLEDRVTSSPIVNADISIEGKKLGITSDETGFFELKGLQSDWVVQIDFLGYQSRSIPVFQFLEDCGKIFLTEANQQLEEILISDYLTQGMAKHNDGSIRVSPRKLGILPGLTEPDVLESLQLLPGVQSPLETSSGLHIRGGTPDHNLVLFDGITMYQSGHFFGLISSFNPYITQKIKMYRSGTRSKYGERIGGVLDISSGEEIPEPEVGFGANLLHADAYVKTPLFRNKVGLIFSARRSFTDVFNTLTYQKFSEAAFQNTRILEETNEKTAAISSIDNRFFFHDYNLKLIAHVSENDKLVFSNLYNRNKLHFFSKDNRFGETIQDDIFIENKGFYLKWDKKWNPIWNQRIAVSRSEYTSDYQGLQTMERLREGILKETEFKKDNALRDFGLNFEWEASVSQKSTWSQGYQYSQKNVSYQFQNQFFNDRGNPVLEIDDAKNETHALFAEYAYKDASKWWLTAGLRFQHFSLVSQSFLVPRLFLSHQATPTLRWQASAEIKTQALSQIVEFRNTGLALENDIWALSTPNRIPVLKSRQVTAGILFQKGGWNLDIDFYRKRILGMSLLTEDFATKTRKYLSATSDIQGVDFLLKKRFGKYRSWISYTFSKTTYQNENLQEGVPFVGNYDVPHSFVWSHTYRHKNLEFSLGWKLRSGTPYTRAIGFYAEGTNINTIYETQINGNRLPKYQKLDLSSTYTFSFSKTREVRGKLGISFRNVLNRRNVLDRTYEVNRNQSEGEEIFQLVVRDKMAIGFTPNVVFRVVF